MPGRPPGWIVLGIIAALEDGGETTRAELGDALRARRDEISSVITRMRRPTSMHPKRIYIARYVYDHEGSNIAYPRAVYALGDKPDAKKPKPDKAAVARRHRESKRVRVASIWELAKPRRQREAEARQRKSA